MRRSWLHCPPVAASNVAEPPVPPACLDRCDPSTQRVEDGNDHDPDQVDAGEADAKAFREVAVVRQELPGCKALRNSEPDRCGMDEIEMGDVKGQRRAPECRENVPERTVDAIDKCAS